MPNRILRESILDSEAVNALSPEAEVFYRRLMSVVDDFGRFDARPAVLRSRLYPLQLDRVREASVERCLAECEAARLVRLYTVNGGRYLSFPKLGVPRANSSKYPPPPDEACAQTRADAGRCAQVRPYSDSDSSSYSDSDSSSDSGRGSGEPAGPDSPPPAEESPQTVLQYPVVGKKGPEWALTGAVLGELQSSYPNLDVLAECQKARQWCIANAAKRKTHRGMHAFLVNWLNKATDRPRPAGAPAAGPPAGSFAARIKAAQELRRRELGKE